MWWGGRQRLDVFVGERFAAGCAPGVAPWMQQTESFGSGVDAARQWLAGYSGRGMLHIWLGATTCPPLFVAKVDGQFDQRAREQMAMAMAKRVLGDAGDIRLWVEASGRGDELVATAIRADRLAPLLALRRGLKMQLGRIGPWWGEVLDRLTAPQTSHPAAVLIADTDALIIAAGQAGAYSRLSIQSLGPDSLQWPQQMARASVGLDGAVEGPIITATLGGHSSTAAPLPDFALPIAMAHCALWTRQAS